MIRNVPSSDHEPTKFRRGARNLGRDKAGYPRKKQNAPCPLSANLGRTMSAGLFGSWKAIRRFAVDRSSLFYGNNGDAIAAAVCKKAGFRLIRTMKNNAITVSFKMKYQRT